MTVEMWELVAREHIRDTLARYNWSGDAGRLDDLADTFCADGVLAVGGQPAAVPTRMSHVRQSPPVSPHPGHRSIGSDLS
jgi:hypothetical protein